MILELNAIRNSFKRELMILLNSIERVCDIFKL